MKLVYTDVAVEDLKRFRAFIAANNPSAAARTAAELVGKIELLPDFPEMGAPVALAPVPESVRDMVFGKYVVRYSVHISTVIILRVWHAKTSWGHSVLSPCTSWTPSPCRIFYRQEREQVLILFVMREERALRLSMLESWTDSGSS